MAAPLSRDAEPSASLGFSGNRLERRSEHRADDGHLAAFADPAARVLLLSGSRTWLRNAAGGRDPFFTAADASDAGASGSEAVLLGWDENGAPVLAVPLAAGAVPPTGVEAVELRALHAGALLAPPALGALAQGAALLHWHASHRFCSRCGRPSESRGGGVKRLCPHCGAEHFPRTDPVAIMLAALPAGNGREGRCLLGRGRHFAPGVFSCLAGFIEPGETIEDAVRRETFEESGVRLGAVRFHASQPWPFPHSLMIGCLAEALGDEITPDESELEACRWFGRDEVRRMLDGTHPDGLRVPPRSAIATALIAAWAEEAGTG